MGYTEINFIENDQFCFNNFFKSFKEAIFSPKLILHDALKVSKIEVPRDVRNSKSKDMARSNENGLNIKQRQVPNVTGPGVSVLCWISAPVAMFYGNLPKFDDKVKIGNKVL